MGGSDRAAVHTRRIRHPFAFACTACCKNWFEGSHRHSRRHRCHIALSGIPKGYPLSHLSEVWDRTRFVDISKLAWALRESVCDSLIGLHAFTGCDTVSAFASRGKLSALKLMKGDITYQETFSQVGQSWDVQPQLFEKVQQFTCRMYVAASSTTEVNDLRYQLVCAKRGEIESNLLPPCRDCLFMHLLRANYQAAIWKCCLRARPTVPDPTKCRWIDEDGKLAIHWMRSPPAPDAVLELLACKCVRSCKLPKCACMANGLSCTYMCRLQSCSNQKQQEDDDDNVELGDSDDEIDEQLDD